MQGAKPEARKPITIADLLRGINYDPDLGTMVKISCNTNCTLNGHRAWVRKMMPTWIKQLNFYSGGNVHSWSIEKSKSASDFQINLEMFFSGTLNKKNLHPRMATALSGQLRKLIAMEIIEKYPPPFDVKDPLFAKTIPDIITINLSSSHDSDIKQFTKAFEDGSAEDAIRTCLLKFGAHLTRFFKNSKGFMEYGVIFMWNKDTSREERNSMYFNDGLSEFLRVKYNVRSNLPR